uniref:Uncharacterized protein n=1 Tax=Hordeum vulgare subsp. vulgare TaxID=112509 RepID=A0A8I6XXZ7_HORVV
MMRKTLYHSGSCAWRSAEATWCSSSSPPLWVDNGILLHLTNIRVGCLVVNWFADTSVAQGMLGVLTIVDGGDNEDGRTLLKYSILRNKQWHLEKFIPTPMEHIYMLGVAGGYVLLATGCTIPSQGKRRFFSVDVKTLQVELFGEGSLGGELYAGFRPSLCAPTI